MRQWIYEVENSQLFAPVVKTKDLAQLIFPTENDFYFIPTNSGKAALYIILAYLKSIKKLSTKNDSVWVPQWLGSWVYNTMQKLCFPTLEHNKDTKAVLIYHQYGYPQNLDKLLPIAKANNMFVIEDCAHALESHYHGKRLGTLGDAAIFSFSKFFPALMGGAILTKNKDLADYATNYLKESKAWLSVYFYLTKWTEEKLRRTFLATTANHLLEMGYAVYEQAARMNKFSKNKILAALMHNNLKKRAENKIFFLQQLQDTNLFRTMNHDDITPYVLPLFGQDDFLQQLKNKLLQKNIATDIYNFDLNQDMSNPDFRNCLWIPIHPGIRKRQRNLIVTAIKETQNEQ